MITKLEILADYGGVTGFWKVKLIPIPNHYPVTYEQMIEGGVTIPKDLYDRVYAWNREYDIHCPYDGREWDRADAWAAEGFALAREVKRAVGSSIEVIYFDERTLERTVIEID